MENFKSVPVDPDTTIINEQEVEIGQISALYQLWGWEGITAESIIFHQQDVENLGDDELFELINDKCKVSAKSGYTVKRSSSGFTFFNFNFKDFED